MYWFVQVLAAEINMLLHIQNHSSTIWTELLPITVSDVRPKYTFFLKSGVTNSATKLCQMNIFNICFVGDFGLDVVRQVVCAVVISRVFFIT